MKLSFLLLAGAHAMTVEQEVNHVYDDQYDQRGKFDNKFTLDFGAPSYKENDEKAKPFSKPGKPDKPNKPGNPSKPSVDTESQLESLSRLNRVFGNLNQWIKDNAGKYKKKAKLQSITSRLKLRFERTLRNPPCAVDERAIAGVSGLEEDLQARSGPSTPMDKAVKYAKVLRKIKSEYLGDCKKVSKIGERINRIEIALIEALEKQNDQKYKNDSKLQAKADKARRKMDKKAKKASKWGEILPLSTTSPPATTPLDEATTTSYYFV